MVRPVRAARRRRVGREGFENRFASAPCSSPIISANRRRGPRAISAANGNWPSIARAISRTTWRSCQSQSTPRRRRPRGVPENFRNSSGPDCRLGVPRRNSDRPRESVVGGARGGTQPSTGDSKTKTEIVKPCRREGLKGVADSPGDRGRV